MRIIWKLHIGRNRSRTKGGVAARAATDAYCPVSIVAGCQEWAAGRIRWDSSPACPGKRPTTGSRSSNEWCSERCTVCERCVATLVVSCPRCGAEPNASCSFNGYMFDVNSAGTHTERMQRFESLTELELAVIRALRVQRNGA